MSKFNALARVNGKPVGVISINEDFSEAVKIAKILAKNHYGNQTGEVIVDIRLKSTKETKTWLISQTVQKKCLTSRNNEIYFDLKQTAKKIPYQKEINI